MWGSSHRHLRDWWQQLNSHTLNRFDCVDESQVDVKYFTVPVSCMLSIESRGLLGSWGGLVAQWVGSAEFFFFSELNGVVGRWKEWVDRVISSPQCKWEEAAWLMQGFLLSHSLIIAVELLLFLFLHHKMLCDTCRPQKWTRKNKGA